MIGGFYRPDAGSIRLGGARARRRAGLEGRPAPASPAPTRPRSCSARSASSTTCWPACAAAGSGIRWPAPPRPTSAPSAEGLLAFVGYTGALDTPAQDLPHVDRRLVEIARAVATRPEVLLLDEPAAGLMRADKAGAGRACCAGWPTPASP